ncbi:permease-like cell division protein FtsX [Patescibacteria group bacterium]|nr:permease-like cell division protein FtsX [Patescibacteria group bacterium]MBU1016035.1 permease-like cell division protein FtsX [Patescibacteria group bacterium]MBU1685545.1 permease-like cell division protein FtsX [Patescibacteria group bacterium]MBU1938256.1 permease-like cell division protein FtsX [Patescibacteria group bacterium]
MRENPLTLQVIWVKRAMKNAWHSILRNKILSLATILIIALMLFVFNLVLAMRYASDSVIANVGEKLDISVEIQSGVENYSIQVFVKTMKEHINVKEVVYISKGEAMAKFGSKYPNVISFLDHYNLENPLPDTVRIITTDVADNNLVIEFLERPQFAGIVNQEKLMKNVEQKDRNAKILGITRSIQRLSWWLIVIFAAVGLMIIFNSININIHNHEKEINVMKLVGAKYNFIRSGFLFEGVGFAISALVISLIFSRLILAYLARNLAGVISNETLMAGMNSILLHFEDNFWVTFGWQLLAVIAAGLLSSYLAIELYLRKHHAF